MQSADSFGRRCFLILIAAGVGSVINLYQIKMIIHDTFKELQATKTQEKISREDLRADIELVMMEVIRMRDVFEKLLTQPDGKSFYSDYENRRGDDENLR